MRDSDAKQQQLEGYRVMRATGYLRTQQGVRVDHTDDSLTYKHLKAVAAVGAGIELLRKAGIDGPLADGQDVVAAAGVVSTTAAEDTFPDQFCEDFASALAKHRAWERETASVPA
jgi:C-terminal domain found in long catalases